MQHFLHQVLKLIATLLMVVASTFAQATTMNVTIQAQVTNNAGGDLYGVVNNGDIMTLNVVVESTNPDASESSDTYTSTHQSHVETLFVVLVDGPAKISTTGSTTWTASGLLNLTPILPASYIPWSATIRGAGMTPDQILANFSSISGGDVYLDASAVAGPGKIITADVVSVSVTTWTDSDGDGIGNAGDNDDDNDGMPDAWEMEFGTNPLIHDAAADPDRDGFSNFDEFSSGWDPFSADIYNEGFSGFVSDSDTIYDIYDAVNATSFNTPDADADRMPDYYEQQFGLNPLIDDAAGDLDRDGYTNIEEHHRGTYPNAFNPSLVRNDMNGDGDSDLLTRNSSTGEWRFYGIANAALAGSQYLSIDPASPVQYITRLDANGDNKADILTRSTRDGTWTAWSVNLGVVSSSAVDMTADLAWQFQGAGDFNHDGIQDVLLRNTTTGFWYTYLFNGDGTTTSSSAAIYSNAQFVMQAIGDLNGDQRDDVLLRSTSTGAWYVYNYATASVSIMNSMWRNSDWQFQALMDVNHDGRDDIVCRITNPLNSDAGMWASFLLGNSFNITSVYGLSGLYANLSVIALADTGDYDGNGTGDFLLRNTSNGTYYIFTTNTPNDPRSGQQTMRGYPAIAGGPYVVLK